MLMKYTNQIFLTGASLTVMLNRNEVKNRVQFFLKRTKAGIFAVIE